MILGGTVNQGICVLMVCLPNRHFNFKVWRGTASSSSSVLRKRLSPATCFRVAGDYIIQQQMHLFL